MRRVLYRFRDIQQKRGESLAFSSSSDRTFQRDTRRIVNQLPTPDADAFLDKLFDFKRYAGGARFADKGAVNFENS